MMGRRTPVLAVSGALIVHYRSLSEAAEAAGVSKVDIHRAIKTDRMINGWSYDYDLDAEYFQDLEERDG